MKLELIIDEPHSLERLREERAPYLMNTEDPSHLKQSFMMLNSLPRHTGHSQEQCKLLFLFAALVVATFFVDLTSAQQQGATTTSITNQLSRKCVSVWKKSIESPSRIAQVPCNPKSKTQQWTFKQVDKINKFYQIYAGHAPNLCMGMSMYKGSTDLDGAPLVQLTCDSSNSRQLFKLLRRLPGQRNEFYQMSPVSSLTKCIQVQDMSMANNVRMVQFPCSLSVISQRWFIQTTAIPHITPPLTPPVPAIPPARKRPLTTAPATGAIVNQVSGKCMGVWKASVRSPSRISQVPCNPRSKAQQWTFVKSSTTSGASSRDLYQIFASHSPNLCMGMSMYMGTTEAEGAPLVQLECDSSNLRQLFRVIKKTSGQEGSTFYHLRPLSATRKCIQVEKSMSISNNVRFEQYACDLGEPLQKWTIEAELASVTSESPRIVPPTPAPRTQIEPEVRIFSKLTRTCVEINKAQESGGSKAILSECDKAEHQTFAFKRSPGGEQGGGGLTSSNAMFNIVATHTSDAPVEQCLSVRWNTNAVIQADCKPTQPVQTWEIIFVLTQKGGKHFSLIRNKLSKECLAVDRPWFAATRNAVLSTCDENNIAQLWETSQIEPARAVVPRTNSVSTLIDYRQGFGCDKADGAESGFTFNGRYLLSDFPKLLPVNATNPKSPCFVRLTPDQRTTVPATSVFVPFAFFKSNLHKTFSMVVDYRIYGGRDGTADGMVFVMHQDRRGSSAIGRTGQFLGTYSDSKNTLIYPALNVELDTYDNGLSTLDSAGEGVHVVTTSPTGVITELRENNVVRVRTPDGTPGRMWIDYCGDQVLKVYVNKNGGAKPRNPQISIPQFDLNTLFLGNQVFLGFTAGTGDEADFHDIISWNFVQKCSA